MIYQKYNTNVHQEIVMSQDQATQSKTENKEAAVSHSSRTQHTVHDAMATEEIRSSFEGDETGRREESETKKDTTSFRLGLAEAFAQEEIIETEAQYEPPHLLSQIQEFMSSFDFDDRSNSAKGYEAVTAIHRDIGSVQAALRAMQGQSSFSFQARNQIQEDLYRLQSFHQQASDYMEETKPRF